ncbi:MAG: UV DNA damage repair endonuclease UvsE, partial [Parachlamydiales bacterium]
MLRFGLCCLFKQEKITFKTATFSFLKHKTPSFCLSYLEKIILHNVENLQKALVYCSRHQIGAFRVTSRFFPLFTHPGLNYRLEDL